MFNFLQPSQMAEGYYVFFNRITEKFFQETNLSHADFSMYKSSPYVEFVGFFKSLIQAQDTIDSLMKLKIDNPVCDCFKCKHDSRYTGKVNLSVNKNDKFINEIKQEELKTKLNEISSLKCVVDDSGTSLMIIEKYEGEEDV